MSHVTRSIIIPFCNEEACARFVLEDVRACQPDAEIIAVDDGSCDGTWAAICGTASVTGLRLTENRGQSAALYAGMRAASAVTIVLMDGDGLWMEGPSLVRLCQASRPLSGFTL